mmetsp:Transcript_25577/g.53596  ORF Transcript_25577/g.53596 Transcript_25577/m.53596 type:complete len:115 (-) Transcript_25577:92-436(-)
MAGRVSTGAGAAASSSVERGVISGCSSAILREDWSEDDGAGAKAVAVEAAMKRPKAVHRDFIMIEVRNMLLCCIVGFDCDCFQLCFDCNSRLIYLCDVVASTRHEFPKTFCHDY